MVNVWVKLGLSMRYVLHKTNIRDLVSGIGLTVLYVLSTDSETLEPYGFR